MDIENESGIDRPTENWTRFPNCILDNLQDIDGSELKVLALMIRKTLGWRDKANKKFAAKYVAVKIGISERTAWKNLLSLQARGLIRCIGKEWHGLKLYEVNWNKPKARAKIDPQKLRSKNRPAKSAVLPPQNLRTVLETITKETIEDHDLPVTPPLYEQESKNKNKDKTKKKTKDSQEYIRIRELMQSKDSAFIETKGIKAGAERMIKKVGGDCVAVAVEGRAILKSADKLWWSYLFSDEDAFAACVAAGQRERAKILDMKHRFEIPEREMSAEEIQGLHDSVKSLAAQ